MIRDSCLAISRSFPFPPTTRRPSHDLIGHEILSCNHPAYSTASSKSYQSGDRLDLTSCGYYLPSDEMHVSNAIHSVHTSFMHLPSYPLKFLQALALYIQPPIDLHPNALHRIPVSTCPHLQIRFKNVDVVCCHTGFCLHAFCLLMQGLCSTSYRILPFILLRGQCLDFVFKWTELLRQLLMCRVCLGRGSLFFEAREA